MRSVSAMLWQRIQSQVSCDCCADGFRQNLVPAHRSRGEVSIMASGPMQGILFARDGLYISGSNKEKVNFVAQFRVFLN